MNLKVRKFTSKKYLKAVAELGCVICANPNSVAHHIKGKDYLGTGYKAPDDMTFPLCHEHHAYLHDKGYSSWEDLYGHQVDYVRLTQDTLSDLLAELKK